MSKISFSKYSGAGNDFILIDNRDSSFPIENRFLIKRLCNRKFGIGADGLILLCPTLHMRIFNQDGSEAQGCGNGLRCLTAFLQELGIYQNEYQIQIG
ncbi:MAG: diaminopimelate epimerase, partial [Chlamydiae bacterium]|nr:diaminopimelate epimerase [Chlamydiota bacterium]